METRSFMAETPGVRLDKFVSDHCADMSRTQAQRLIEEGLVTINGNNTKASYKLTAGDMVVVNIPPPPPSALTPQSMPLNIIYEDDDLLVVDKPAGLTVHPAPGHPAGTLVNALIAHYPRLAELSSSLRPGIVHRLDKDTSGVIVIAKTKLAEMSLVGQFKERTIQKTYLTLVRGSLEPEQGIIEAAIGRHPLDRKKMAVVKDGDAARTRYKVLRYINGYTYLEVKLETGRTHQIRVHLAAIGFPVVGDEVYGIKSPYLERQFLHAHRLAFTLPSTGKRVEFTSPLPPDLERALKAVSQNE